MASLAPSSPGSVVGSAKPTQPGSGFSSGLTIATFGVVVASAASVATRTVSAAPSPDPASAVTRLSLRAATAKPSVSMITSSPGGIDASITSPTCTAAVVRISPASSAKEVGAAAVSSSGEASQ